jgi:hypothetical protein
MAIHYILRDNKNTPDPNDCYAVVVPTGSVDMDELMDAMAAAGSTLGRTDMAAFFEVFTTVLAAKLLNGERVNLPFGSFFTSVEGVFDSPVDTFDASRHKVRESIAEGPRIRQILQAQATMQKDIAPLPQPVMIQYKDVNTGAINSTVTSGGLGEIKGEDLKFNPAAADEGIYFVPTSGQPVKVTVISQNTQKSLTFQNPHVTGLHYTPEVRKRFQPTGALRTGGFPTQLLGVVSQPGP